MSKRDESREDRSIKIGKDATGNVIVTGDGNVVNMGGGDAPNRQRDRSVPKVFVSSTSEDLKPYRAAARDAAIKADCLPVQMEYFAASGEHPPLKACLEKVDEADVVVLIIAHRYGWVPDDQDGDEHKSITWLECERAKADGKEVLAFVVDDQHPWDAAMKEESRISSAALALDGSATPELLAEVLQNIKRLRDFKAWVDAGGMRAKFTTPEDFGWKAAEALREWKQRHVEPDGQPPVVDVPPPRKAVFPPAYREWLQRKCADIDLLGVKLRQGQAVKLNNVYVPLITAAAREDADVTRGPADHQPRLERLAAGKQDPQLLLGLLDRHSLYVAGNPGTGKSTFCRWVAWLVAVGSMPAADVAAPEPYVESFPASLANRLPVLFELRRLWNALPADAGRDSLSHADMETVLSGWLDSNRPGGLAWDDVVPHLEDGSALLIFDGVDEVPLRMGEGRQAYYPRAMLLAGLASAARRWQERGNRLLLTSRPYGIDEQQRRELPLRSTPISDLDETLQKLLVRRWFGILKDDADEAAETASDMLHHLAQRPELGVLTANSMLLTATCIIFDQGKRLPHDKHDLYEQIVDNVLYNRYRNDMSELEMAREHLGVVAYGMHTGIGLGAERTTPQPEASYQDVDRLIQNYHDNSGVTYSGYINALETRDELLQRSGLLISRDHKKAGFYHYTFQDFLAARRIAGIQRDRLFEIFVEHAPVAEWRNTLSFLFSGELANSRDQASGLLTRLIEQTTPETLGLSVVVADCLEALLGRHTRLRHDVEGRFRDVCLAAIDNEVDIKSRATLGLALGRLGDPRIVTDLRDAAAYVEVPAGKYAFQDGEQTLEEGFRLARYPVTNSQFAQFISEGGYENDAHWTQVGWQWRSENGVVEPGYWRDTKWNAPNQPVVGVSFYEAEAFCRWAGGFLPGERQWEAAARGTRGYDYPWGNDWEDGICNSVEAGLGVTSAVGLFPRSRSQELGLEDMAGNVWEWCSDLDSRVWDDGRVLRGGSFLSFAPLVRSAYRHLNYPVNRDYNLGFRVARTYP